MFGGVMKLNLVRDSTRLFRREYFIEACSIVDVQVVLHQPNLLDPRVKLVYAVADAVDIVSPDPSLGHHDRVPAWGGFAHHELAADSFPLVLVVNMYGRERTGQVRWSHLAEQLFACFVQDAGDGPQAFTQSCDDFVVTEPLATYDIGPKQDWCVQADNSLLSRQRTSIPTVQVPQHPE
jgi:hypothetical protein